MTGTGPPGATANGAAVVVPLEGVAVDDLFAADVETVRALAAPADVEWPPE